MVEVDAGVGSVFREMRKAAGLSADALAAKIGYDRSHIYRIESGQNEPSLELAKKWVIATGSLTKNPGLVIKLLLPNEYLSVYRAKRREQKDERNNE